MVLKFKDRTNPLKKVMVYGKDGTGKSTFAAQYCSKHNLTPVVIDIDDTNYTDLPILELNFRNDRATFKSIELAIKDITSIETFDTIILDGVTSLLEMLVSDARGMAKYSDRASRFQKILQALLSSGKNLIFIGQADMEVIFTEEFQSSKMVIKVNSIVNEKYLCEVDEKGNFTTKTMKFRTMENNEKVTIPEVPVEPPVQKPAVMNESKQSDVFMTAAEIGEPKPEDDPVRNSCIMIKEMLENEGIEVTKMNMRNKVWELISEGILPEENRKPLAQYITKHCPEGLE